MKAKDLLQAMNDIDPKLLEGTEPWGEPAKKLHRPPWAVAVAAGLVLCVALGAGTLMMKSGVGIFSANEGEQGTASPLTVTAYSDLPDLEFAVNDTEGQLDSIEAYAGTYEEGTEVRDLTLDELAYFRSQEGLLWLQDYYLTGWAVFSPEGTLIQLSIQCYDPELVDLTASPPLLGQPFAGIYLSEGDLPSNIRNSLYPLEEPNNQVGDVDVWAVELPYSEKMKSPATEQFYSKATSTYFTGCTLENGLSMGCAFIADIIYHSEEECVDLATLAANQAVYEGIRIDQLQVEPTGNDRPNVNYGDSYHLIMLGPQGTSAPLDFAPYTVETPEDYGSYEEFLEATRSDFPQANETGNIPEGTTSEKLTWEEIASIWDGNLPWDEDIPVEGWANYNKDGHLDGIYIYGSIDQKNQAIESEFLVTLKPGPLDWDAICAKELSYDIITEPNNRVAEQDVYAVTTGKTNCYVDPETNETVDMGKLISYNAYFQMESPSQVAVSVSHYIRGASSEDPPPEELQAAGLAQQEAQALVESVVGHSLYHWISLGHLYMQGAETASSQTEESQESSSLQASSSQPETPEQPSVFQEESPLDLSFTVRPNEDETFSNVWNTFTTLYLEPQNLAAHGAEPDYELSEEELRSIWGGELPWEGMLTENDTVTAYGYFSEDGELIKVYVGGHRDNPESPTTEAYQIFSVSLYNMELTGQWGQDAKEMLALADSQFQGVDIATQQIASTQDYDDGSSMDFTVYSAGFVPTAGPTLMVVDGFHSPVAFTQEEARSFVNLVTEVSLLNGVTLGNVDD